MPGLQWTRPACCYLNYPLHSDAIIQQADINEKMRAILTDWLVEVHLKFKVR